jgi:signal transduction histidine kinase
MRARALQNSQSRPANETTPVEQTDTFARGSVGALASGGEEGVHDERAVERQQLLAKLSHELRTPLNAIIGFSKLLHAGKAGPLSTTQAEYVGDVLSSSHHLLKLINEVLELAKLEVGGAALKPELLDPARIADEVSGALGNLAVAKQQRIVLDADSELGELLLDRDAFKQVLLHFLSNAIRFTPEEGTIRLRLRVDGPDHFRLEVEDSGPGIAAEDLGRLFMPFQKLDGRKRHAGSGLGLAIAKRLVEAQGGTVAVESALERGSIFSARLPRRAPNVRESHDTPKHPGKSA